LIGVLGTGAEEEGVVGPGSAPGPGQFVDETLRGRRGWIGIGHLAKGGDASGDGREGAGGEVFLVLVARFAEMDLRIDQAGEDEAPPGIETWGLCGGGQVGADGGDPPIDDPYIYFARSLGRNDAATVHQKIS
jgi:hypothetical protein